MADLSHHTATLKGSPASTPGRKPRVQLPQAQARDNPAEMPSQWATVPGTFHSVLPIAPNAMSYDQSFPSLGMPQPRVNLPTGQPKHDYHPLDGPPITGNDLESRMRGMIITNSGQRSNQYGPIPPSQKNKRPPIVQVNGSSGSLPPGRAFQGQNHHPAPHLQDINAYRTPKQAPFTHNQPYDRPQPHHRQLFDPASAGPRAYGHVHHQSQAGGSSANSEAQVEYLDHAACLRIPEVEMTHEESDEKESLRKSLEQACQKAVGEYEKSKSGNDFGIESVELKCFGSMSTTFATKSSDMDLVLLSPLSKPDVSSPDSQLPRLIEKTLLSLGYGARLLTKTRVPIIRFCEKPTPELATLLLSERTKFDIEQAASSSSPKKDEKKANKSGKCKSAANQLPNQPDCTIKTTRVGGSESSEIDKAGKLQGNNGIPQGATLRSSPNDAAHPKKDLEPSEGKVPSMQTEEEDPQSLTRTDEERCRLYRLAIREGWYEPPERQVITLYIQKIERRDTSESEKVVARSPLKTLPNVIGRYRAPPEAHPLDFPKTGVGIQCDINFSNHLALHNSHLLKCYSMCDRRVRLMVLFIKAWSKKRKINTPYHGTLSSYGFVLMVLHYLINVVRPPVLINLQQTPYAFTDELSAKIVELEGHNVQFLRNEAVIETLVKRNAITQNTESVGSLLCGFFRYYARQGYGNSAGGFAWTSDVLSLRTIGGIVTKSAKGWTGAKTETVELKGPGPQQTKDIRQRYLLAIEDPFETEHNIARTVVHSGIVAIRDEFRRALTLVENAGFMPRKGREDLFAEAEDRENLQYRAFGPRPGHGPGNRGNGRAKAGDGGAASAAPTH